MPRPMDGKVVPDFKVVSFFNKKAVLISDLIDLLRIPGIL
jgi:hypothetical protein